jgi:hypothetical protein
LKNDKLDNRIRSEHYKERIPDAKLLMGSLSGKFPVVLDDGRTTVYISDKSKEEETREKYAQLKYNRFPSRSPKSH